MAQPFSVRAALCTGAVMFLFAALATGDLPGWMVQFGQTGTGGGVPILSVPGRGGSPPAKRDDTGQAMDTGCDGVVGRVKGSTGYRFHPPCPGRSVAPNRRWAIETGGEGGVRLANMAGETLDEIPNLADAMPFVVHWSSRSDWFFANHYLGSGSERLRVFQIVNRKVIERSAVFASATEEMVRRYPCLGRRADVHATGHGWSGDGSRIALAGYARADACLVERGTGNEVADGNWEPMWMIGDAVTGRIEPGSVRVQAGGRRNLPSDGPYAGF